MTLDEAIKYTEEVAQSQEYEGKKLEESGEKYHDDYEKYCSLELFECANKYKQLAEFLKDYKRLLDKKGEK